MRRVALLLVGLVTIGGPRAVHAASQCPTTNWPDSLVLAGGTPQIAKVGSQYDSFQVALANSNGCPVTAGVAGVPVTFSSPSSGASGTFAGSGSTSVVVGTNATGTAAASLTANHTAGDFVVVASSQYGSVSFALDNTATGVATTIVRTSAATQTAPADGSYRPLQVRVLDATGAPVAGATVTFSLGGSAGGGGGGGAAGAGASFAGGGGQATALTDDTGTATSPGFSGNGTAGAFTAAASTMGVTQPVTFALRNLPGGESSIAVVGRSEQTATVGARFVQALRVRLLDGGGRPVPDTTVTFSLGAGGGGASQGGASATFAGGAAQATTMTNSRGIAVSPRLTAGSVSGSFTATATATGTASEAVFSLRNLAGRPDKIAAGAAATESAPAGTAFPVPLAVTVTDKDGNAVAGAPVRFTAPAHGASGRFAHRRRSVTMRTDANGVAVAPRFIAGKRQGGYAVVATLDGVGRSAAFALSNVT